MRLFGRRKATSAQPVAVEVTPGEHRVLVVGESHCQPAFIAILGPKTRDGAQEEVVALLECEPSNPVDPNAVGVYVQGHRLGYLPRDIAAVVSPALATRPEPCAVRGFINGGWDRGGGDEGYFGVVVWLPDPSDL